MHPRTENLVGQTKCLAQILIFWMDQKFKTLRNSPERNRLKDHPARRRIRLAIFLVVMLDEDISATPALVMANLAFYFFDEFRVPFSHVDRLMGLKPQWASE